MQIFGFSLREAEVSGVLYCINDTNFLARKRAVVFLSLDHRLFGVHPNVYLVLLQSLGFDEVIENRTDVVAFLRRATTLTVVV